MSKNFPIGAFKASFNVVNAAVYTALRAGLMDMVQGVENTPGATRYDIRLPTGELIFIFVLQRINEVVEVKGYLMEPQDEDLSIVCFLALDILQEVNIALRYV